MFKRALAGSKLLLLVLQQLIQNILFRIFPYNIILCHDVINNVQIVFMTQISESLFDAKMNIVLVI